MSSREKLVTNLRKAYVPFVTFIAIGCGYAGSLIEDWRLRVAYLVPVTILVFYLLHRMAPDPVVDTRHERMKADKEEDPNAALMPPAEKEEKSPEKGAGLPGEEAS